jgi:hypothetical protein
VYGKAGSATGPQHMAEAQAGFLRACKADDEAEERRVANRAKPKHDIIETDGAGKDIVALLEQGEETVDSLLKKQCVQLVKHLTGDSDKGKVGVLKERLRGLQAVSDGRRRAGTRRGRRPRRRSRNRSPGGVEGPPGR